MVDIPPYVKSPDQENYNEELNQTLYQGIGPNGFQIPQLTNAQLTTDPIIDQNGNLTTVSALAQDGTCWYITDNAPPVYVGKISGALVKFTTAAYP